MEKKILGAEYRTDLVEAVQKYLEGQLPEYTARFSIIIEVIPD